MTHKPSHNPALFDQYIQYDGPEGEGFRIAQSDSSTDIYIVDDYGSWVDKALNYYDRDGEPAGYFDEDYNFYDMNGYRIPGGYKGGKTIEREVKKKQKYLDSVPDNSKQKFVVEIQNLPPNTVPIQIINYILDRCDLKQGEIEECKKVQKQATKGYVVVTGADKVQKLLILEGRKFRLQEKDGKYTSNEIQIFVREAKFNNGKQFSNNSNYSKNNQQEQVEQEDDGYKIAFENLDSKKTNQEFINWIVSQTNCKIDEIELKRPNQKPSGQLLLQNENLIKTEDNLAIPVLPLNKYPNNEILKIEKSCARVIYNTDKQQLLKLISQVLLSRILLQNYLQNYISKRLNGRL